MKIKLRFEYLNFHSIICKYVPDEYMFVAGEYAEPAAQYDGEKGVLPPEYWLLPPLEYPELPKLYLSIINALY